MKCPICGSTNRKCVYSIERDSCRTRTYKCFDCGGKYKSKEVITESKAEGWTRFSDLEFEGNEFRISLDELSKTVEELKKRMDKLEKEYGL